jgi:hypothetical protein
MNASKMTIITGLKYEVVETMDSFGRVRVSSFSLDGFKKPILGEYIAPDSVCCRDYYVRGRRICTPNGKEVFLGNAPEVEEFLGLQFDLVDNLTRGREKALEELSKAEKEKSKAEKEKSDALFKLNEVLKREAHLQWSLLYGYGIWQEREDAIKGMSFLRRLKYLFTGELL